ncbi:hypothetical protein C2845_PM11G16690 [Panicum miliaceum]|uniref:non-specific serine/threonine protein kinase n=1 Tax=Panicum miliaceum TaxID=4540 RepID=A0A3L6RSE3_PANMI|nr:hypothetical protein C2845_PM11G16690 [Panicum miliaceum]
MLEAKCVLRLLFYGLHLAAVAVSGGGGDDEFVYSGFSGANLTLHGAAMVTPSGLLQLTDGAAVSKGHAFHPTPLHLRGGEKEAAAARSFSASFVFGIVPVTPGMGGHSLSLVVAPSRDLSTGTASSYLGFLNTTSNGSARNHIVAVELDTIQSPEFQDIDDNHVGLDVNSLVSVNASSAGYYDDRTGEFRNLTLVSGEAMQAWVDYDGDAARIDVTLAPVGTEKPRKPLVSASADLSSVITDVAYVGFSASTGRLSTRHYVLGCSFAVDEPAPAIDMATAQATLRELQTQVQGGLIAGVVALATVACVLLIVRRRYRYVELREDWEIEFGAHRLSYKVLFHATNGFKNKNLLGTGGFGTVYKGVLPTSGTGVAVKRVTHGCSIGYCRLKDELLLAYDYMPNGSVEQHLYGGGDALNWAQRFQIIKGVASGLLYLHEEWEQVVVHRDVKASNILLDGEMNARLGDFGLARLHDRDAELHTTVIAGTFGYIAPELALTGRASPLTDVFAFDAFLLEVTTGRRPVEEAMDGSSSRLMLVDWVFEHWRNESLLQVVDPRIELGDYDVGELSLALRGGVTLLASTG